MASSLAFDLDAIDAQSDLERRWAWVEIDLGAIRHNVMEARRRLPRACRLLAVVKADAYGHGSEQTAKMALNSGADYLGVATGTRFWGDRFPGTPDQRPRPGMNRRRGGKPRYLQIGRAHV